MTEPHKPSPKPHDVVSIKPPSAKQVAREIERRKARRKLFLLLLLAAAIALAIIYGTCGRGWGLGAGKGEGEGEGSGPGSGKALVEAPPIDAGPVRCSIFIASEGITVDNKQVSRDEAVAACKAAGAQADVTVAGDVVQKDWDALEQALSAAGVAWSKQGAMNPGSGSGSGSGSAEPGSTGSADPGSAGSGSDAGSGSAAP